MVLLRVPALGLTVITDPSTQTKTTTLRPPVVHLGKARFTFPPSQTAVRQHAIHARNLRQISIGTGPAGVRPLAGVRVVCLPYLRPPLIGGLLFYTIGPLLALLLALARRGSAITCQSPYEAFGVIALSRILPRRFRPPVRIEVHTDWRTAPRLYGSRGRVVLAPLTDRICRWTLPRATLVRTIGEATTSWVREAKYGGPIERYLEFSDYDVFAKEPTVPPPLQPRVLFVGVLERYKGVDVLLKAWPTVMTAIPDAELTIVGGGTLSRELRRWAASSGLEHAIRFLVPVHQKQLCSLLDQASCLVLPSRSEGLGRVVLEAMARARPVVGSSVGGIPELIEEGRTGRLVPPGDPAALAAALSSVLSDPSAAEKMGHEARESFEELDPAAEYETGILRFAEWVSSSAQNRYGSAHTATE
jgi:glycosyltransferase involved in cell wall biosynthesis